MFKEDLGEFFNDDEMADSAIISGSDVLGIFDNQFAEVHGIESMRPIFTCPESDVLNVKHGDELSIDSSSYKVVGTQPDGTGLISLVLEKQ